MSDTVFELNGATLTVKPAGALDSMTSPAFEEELRQRMPGAGMIIIDLEKVNYISSAGLRVILAAEQYQEKQNAEMKIIHVSENIMEIFEMVGFLDVIPVE